VGSAAVWVPSRARGAWLAVEFDGTDDYVDCGDSALAEFDGDFTVTCRFRSTTGTNQAFVSKWTGSGSGSQWWCGRLNGNVQAGIYTTDGGVDVLDSGAAYKDGDWHHLALVRSGSTGYLYVDSEEKASRAVGVNAAGNNAAPLTLGSFDTGYWPYQGRLDDVRLFHRALDAAEIGELERDSRFYYPKTLNRLRRWLPTPVVPLVAEPPYRVSAGQVEHAGALAGAPFVPGHEAGGAYTCGQVAGQIHG
jgi:hypothetical protein